MIIDEIMDRKNGYVYSAHDFYMYCTHWNDGVGEEITRAMDEGDEYDVRRAIARYIVNNDYNTDLITFTNSVKWLEDAPPSRSIVKRSIAESLNIDVDRVEICTKREGVIIVWIDGKRIGEFTTEGEKL